MQDTSHNNGTVSLDDLAVMVKNGFDGVGEGMKGLKGEINELREEMKKGFEKNERDHEDIQLRLTNVAYRFELVELQRRVEILERKAGVVPGV